jgi:hypothetical protein
MVKNVEFSTDKFEDSIGLDVVVIGASAQQLEDLQRRLDNYYDANGLSSIEVNGNCIAMIFNDKLPGSIERVKGHICDLVMVM